MAFLCEMALPRYHWRHRVPIDCLKKYGEISPDLLRRTRVAICDRDAQPRATGSDTAVYRAAS